MNYFKLSKHLMDIINETSRKLAELNKRGELLTGESRIYKSPPSGQFQTSYYEPDYSKDPSTQHPDKSECSVIFICSDSDNKDYSISFEYSDAKDDNCTEALDEKIEENIKSKNSFNYRFNDK